MEVHKQELDAIKQIVDTCVSKPLFTYEMQVNAPRPSGNYAAVKCLSSENPGFDEVKTTDNGDGTLTQTTKGIRILTFQIMFNRDGQEYIDFDNSFYREDVKQLLHKLKFAAMDKTVLDLATLQLETNWEVRKAVKMRFNVLRTQSYTLGIMSGAKVSGKTYDNNHVVETKG